MAVTTPTNVGPRITPKLTEAEACPAPSAKATARFDERFGELRELARGGQGRVVLAQDGMLRREVALKIPLKSGVSLRRFEREARLAARLQHPGIVNVYDLARRESGEPVLVMRRVQGKPFDHAIEEAGGYAERLGLLAPFIAACDAIAYAHRQGVIHRDIKASNVLIGEFGDTVVIDWGLAKELGVPDEPPEVSKSDDSPSPLLTRTGELLGTPAFMSPEQARGEPADAQSDVYALGAMLYQMLAGRPPYAGKLSQDVLDAVAKGPPPPLDSTVAPELVTIVHRAMARERKDRYATASELAEELKRFQTGRLVASHSYTTWQRLRRWSHRNASLLAVAGIALLVLAVASTVGIRRILAEHERANREAATSRRALDFMTGMFKVADPSTSKGNTVTAREILDSAARDIGTKMADEPEVRARLMRSMGVVYFSLGLYPEARKMLEQAMPALANALGPDHPEKLKAQSALLLVLDKQGELAEAERVALDLTERARRVLGASDELTLQAENQLGMAYVRERRFAEAEKVLRSALETSRASRGAEDSLTLSILAWLARSFGDNGRPGEAEKLLAERIPAFERVDGRFGPATLFAVNTLSDVYVDQGRYDAAEALFRRNLEGMAPVLGREHPATLLAIGGLGWVLYEKREYAEAEMLMREALSGRLKRLGPDHASTLGTRAQLGHLLAHTGRPQEAEKELQIALLGSRRIHDPIVAAFANAGLAMSAMERGAPEQGLLLLREAFVDLTPPDRRTAIADPAFTALHGDPRFEALKKQVNPSE